MRLGLRPHAGDEAFDEVGQGRFEQGRHVGADCERVLNLDGENADFVGNLEVEFAGQIRPHDSLMRYEIEIVRYQELLASGAAVAVGDATIAVDGDVIYTIKRAKVGIFRDIDYADYPFPGERSHGGRMER